jgi:hypothetical protein
MINKKLLVAARQTFLKTNPFFITQITSFSLKKNQKKLNQTSPF